MSERLSKRFLLLLPLKSIEADFRTYSMYISSYRVGRRLSAVRRVVSNDTTLKLHIHSGSEVMKSSSSYKYNNDGTHKGKWGNAGFHRNTGLLGLFVACGAFLIRKTNDSSENCGIVGVVGSDDANTLLLEGLTILRNRGYDSAGVATISPSNEMAISKFASKESTSDCIDLVKKNSAIHSGHNIGIAHTRWATHGGKTDANAHPHTDYNKHIALVHNGTINNSHELRKQLIDRGIVFSSETDTEVIAHLVGLGIEQGLSTKEAVESALLQCDGSWGLAVINKKTPDEMVVACNGSPLVIGMGQGKTFVASETSAFNRYTKNFVAMKDGEIGIVRADTSTIDLSRMETAPDHDILLSPAPHAHFTLKEALEQPEAIARALSYGARMNGREIVLGGLNKNKDQLAGVHNLLLTGCGTSKYAAELGAKIMRDLECFDSVAVMDSSEVRRTDVPPRKGGMLAVSQSGETKDVVRALKTAEEKSVVTMSVVNAVGSLISRKTNLGVYLNAGRENAVASTKAFSTQVTVLCLIGLWFHQLREDRGELPSNAQKQIVDELIDSLQRLPISFGMARSQHNRCKDIATELVDKRSMFILGKGYGEPIASEGALKIKEMCYLHAEGYSGGALKHGPFALIEGDDGRDGATPVVMLILDDEHANHMRIAAEEVKARGAKVYVITDRKSLARGIDDNPIVISHNGPLTALTAVLPLQLIGYELALLKGINPDTPRNLAKAVTTD